MTPLKGSFWVLMYLWNAAAQADMARLSIVQQQMQEMLDHHSHLKDINLKDVALPKEQDTTTNAVDNNAKNIAILQNCFFEVNQFWNNKS